MSHRAATAAEPLLIGRYALFDELASGGMATVHLGRLLGSVGFGRTVAIKRLHHQFLDDEDFISMFMDEARIVARIVHPNVVPMVDVVQGPQGLFLVMEYVHGESLARLLRIARANEERVPIGIACAVIHNVLLGLHAAHETKEPSGKLLDVVHRDVSPQNVIVGTDGVARVLDFGIAKAAGRIQVTREGQIKGKLAYMAPEQIRGNVDRRTDVFAAGVVLWEMLANRRLHDGLKDIDIVSRVVNGQLSAPSTYAHDLPAVLDAIVLKSLATDPANRFASAREFAIEIERNAKLASSSEVSEWVERLAHDTISVRSDRVAAMERASQDMAPMNVAQAPDRIPTLDEPYEQFERFEPFDVEVGNYDMALRGTTSSGVFAHTQTSPNSRAQAHPSNGNRGLGFALFALFVLLGITGAVLGVSAIRQRNSQASQPAPPSAAPVPKAAAVASIATSAASAASAAAPQASATNVGADAGAEDVRAAPSVLPAPKPVVTSRPTGTLAVPPPKPSSDAVTNKKAGASCDPPFTVDEAGHRHYKSECLE